MKLRTLAAAASAAAIAVALCGCTQQSAVEQESGPAGEQQQEKAAQYAQPEIVKSGYSDPSEDGYLYWWAVGVNPNDDAILKEPAFRATAYDDEGNVLDTETWPTYLNSRLSAYPGAQYGFSSVLSVDPDTFASVEIEPVSTDESDFSKLDGEAPVYEVSKTTVNSDSIGIVKASGEVSNGGSDDCNIEVFVVLVDSEGNIVNGGYGWADDVPAGGSVPFSINLDLDVAEYDTAEFYAIPDTK